MFPQPIMQMVNMLQNNNTQNPMLMIKQMSGNNPMLKRAVQMAEGKSPAQMQQVVRNLAAQRGVSPQQLNQMLEQFGLKV